MENGLQLDGGSGYEVDKPGGVEDGKQYSHGHASTDAAHVELKEDEHQARPTQNVLSATGAAAQAKGWTPPTSSGVAGLYAHGFGHGGIAYNSDRLG